MDNPLLFMKQSYQKISKAFHRRKIPLPTPLMVFFFCIATLCGRATLFGMLKPFGGAFFAAIFTGRFSYIYIIGAILGQISSSSPLYETGKYIFAMTCYALIVEKLPPDAKQKASVRSGFFAASLALSGLCFMFTSSRGIAFTTAYDLMLLFLECSIAFCATAAFYKAIPIIKNAKLSHSFTSAEEISLVSFLGCALWGAKDIASLGIVNLADVVCILIVLVFSVRLGTSHGVIAGLTMGLVSALGSGRVDISCVSYAFSALAASMVGNYGALPASCAFILANALVTALANGSTEVLISLYDILTACIIYALIPEQMLLRLTGFGSRDEKDLIALDERHYCESVLSTAKNSLSILEKRIEELHTKRHSAVDIEERFFERTARKGCIGCGLRRVCWSRDLQKTVGCLTKALSDSIETGKLKSEMLPSNCLRPKEFREAFLYSAEIYRIEKMWQGKMSEMSTAAKNQLSAFSEIISAALTALSCTYTFDRALSDDISRRLQSSDIACRDVTVMRDSDGDPTVMLKLENCNGFSLCDRGVADIISSACGKEMIRTGKRDCSTCSVRYAVKPPYAVSFASSGKSSGKRSGDSVRWRIINKSLYAAVLCDGMGTGDKAAMEARSAAETLLDLIEAGVEGEAAVGMVNSLFLPYGEATFSATDLYLYNAAEKTVKIVKCGAVASFTKSGERVDALYSKSLPIGSVLTPGIETFTLSAKEGDITVMISDGVLDPGGENALKDTWLIDCLEGFSGDNPRTLTDSILSRALEKCNNAPKDDITVLAAIIK